MRYVQRKLLLLAASAAFALVYFGLQGYSFATEAAYCASYTVLVFGNALRKTGMGLISGEEAKPLLEVLLVHTVFLMSLIGIFRIGTHVGPMLPEVFQKPIGSDGHGRPGPTGLRIAETLAITGLGWVEQVYLASKNPLKKDGQPADKTKVLWGQAAWEEDRMNRLRLR